MPWKIADVASHMKGLTPKQEERWVSIANSARAQCIKDGGKESECDGKAIRIANSAMKESVMEKWLEGQPAEVQDKFANLQAEK